MRCTRRRISTILCLARRHEAIAPAASADPSSSSDATLSRKSAPCWRPPPASTSRSSSTAN
eukprot:scaffold117240_cov48-Phaeocystis_antarctica.AAC.1